MDQVGNAASGPNRSIRLRKASIRAGPEGRIEKVVSPRLLTMLVIRSDTRFSGLDQDDLVGALGFAPGFYCPQTRAETLKHLVCLGRREEKSAGWGMANSVTRLCHNCAVKPAYAAQVAIFDSSRLLIPCKLQKLRGGPDNPAYRLIREILHF